jgi:hypothetical protein
MLPELHNILLGIHGAFIDGSIVIGSDQHRRGEFGAQLEEFIDIGFPVTYCHELGIAAHRSGVLQRFEPPITFFVFNGEDVSMLGTVWRHRLSGEDLLIQESQW